MAWMSYYIPLFYMDVITYPYSIPSVGLADIGNMYHCSLQRPWKQVYGANMGPTWVLSAPGGPHVGHVNLAIWDDLNQWWLYMRLSL